jgi:adenylate cyclase
MDAGTTPDVILFEQFRFDRHGGVLSRRAADGEFLPVSLGSRALAVLDALVERAGDLVSKDEIMRAVWPGTAVEEANLTMQISALRRALDADRGGNSSILTVPGRGYRFLPNVRRPADPIELPAATIAPPRPRRGWPGKWLLLVAAVFAAALLVIGLAAGVFSPDASPPRLSIVVLPFENLNGDPKDSYLVEGVTGDVTANLSRVPGMFVIARETAYTYQGKPIDVRKLSQELGVRYVVEGSVHRIGDTLRVSAELIAAETRAQLWADRFDQKLGDLSVGQDAIVSRIGQTLKVALADIEIARSKRERPTNPDAFDLILRARSLALHTMGLQEHAERRALLEQALQLDPRSIYAMTELAFEISREQVFVNANGDDPERAAKLIATAAEIDPNNLNVLSQTAHLLFTNERYGEAVAAYQRLLDEYPNASGAYYLMGASLIPLGRSEEAIRMVEETLRRDPLSGWNYDRYADIGFANLLLGRDEESIVWNQRALAASPNSYPIKRAAFLLQLAAAHARLGHLDEAHRALAEADREWPYATVRGTSPGYAANRIFTGQIEQYQAALRLAGLRDHAEEDAEFGLPTDGNLRQSIPGFTPTVVPGATTIHTVELKRFLDEHKPVLIDTLYHSWGRSIPGAVGLKNAGRGGSTSDSMQDRLRKKMQVLTTGDLATPIVVIGWNSERFDGRNLSLRIAALGYTQIYWYRGGREAWEVAGLPETPVDIQDW